MGQAQDKFMDDQLENNIQDSNTVEENSVVTESTFTLVASDSNIHHNFSFSSQDSHSQDFTNNSLASTLAGLTIHENSNSDNKPATSIIQATTVKNTVKENLNELSKTVEDDNNDDNINNNNNYNYNNNNQITEITINTSSNSIDSINKKSSKEIKSTLADEAEYTIPPSIAEDVLREMLANKPSQELLEELETSPVNTNGKGDNSSSKFKGDSVNHEKIVPMNFPSTTISNAPPILSSNASTSRKGMHPNVGTGRTTTLYVSAKPSIKTVSSTSDSNNSGNMQTPLLVSPTSTMKKSSMKFGDINISSTSLTSATASAKGITISVNNSNSNSSSSSTIQTSPPPRGFIHNATNAPTQRQIKELPRRAKFRPISKGNNIPNDENNISNNNNNNNICKNESIVNGGFNIKSEKIVSQPSLPIIPPSPLFSFSTPINSEDDDDFDAEEDDGNNVNGHTDWLDNANNKKKRKALQTVGGGSATSGGVGGVMKTLTAKERANPLRRVERRSTQRSNIVKSSSNCDPMLPFDSKSVSKELNGMRPPQTTFDFSFKSISEKSAAAAAASVNAASAKRLAAVSPIQTMNAKNDPFSSSLFLQQYS
ncbi:hypothetical protein C1645_12672 [Glomus cerebriforme]|uniref:Uncharacterized protein n=1 Tax=Glomus cerebriforme TaxID=658196 RepID=A0A397SCT1_9GLOM|nr:hypothetical protein C1645_12672 [Glomus cerebriforme]